MRKITLIFSLLLCSVIAMAQSYTYSLPAEYADASADDGVFPLTAEELNQKTKSTYLVLKCVAKGNHQYYKGTGSGTPANFSNIESDYIFIWEPAGDGKFYLGKPDGTYLQNAELDAAITLGAKETAAKFTCSTATKANDGSDDYYYEGESYFARFTNENSVWINVQEPAGTPKYNIRTGSYTFVYAYEVEATIAGLKISDAPSGDTWAENTTWYKILNKKESEWLSTATAYCNTENYLRLTNKNEPIDDYGLWCIVGDITNGFKFYNKGEGTGKVLHGSRTLNSDQQSFIMSATTTGENVMFDIENSLQAGYIIIKDHNNENNYWNHRDDNLAYWNSANANNNDGSSFKFYYVDPKSKYTPIAFATKDTRQVGFVTLAGSEFGTNGINNYSLTSSEKNSYYADLTKSVTMYAIAGENVDLQCTSIGWMHTYVYIDKDGDGFTASVDATDGYTPLEDLVSYSCYNSVQADGAATSGGTWYNSAGVSGSDNRNDAPNFTAPATAGTYRMRLKSDWNSIRPQGGNQFQSADGAAIDVTLKVVSSDDTDGIAQIKHLAAKNYLSEEITRIEAAKNSLTPTDSIGKNCYSQAKIDEFTTSYINVAKEVLTNAEQKSTEELTTATTTLQQAYTAALTQFNLPIVGKLYRIKSYIKNASQEAYKYHYVAANDTTYTSVADADETTLWLCQEGTTDSRRKFVNYSVANKALDFLAIGTTAYDFELGEGVENGSLCLKKNDATRYMGFTNEEYSTETAKRGVNSAAVAGSKSQSATWSTDFVFELVRATEEEKEAALAIAEGIDNLVGYPVASVLENYRTTVQDNNVTLPELNAAKSALWASTEINMPEDGKAYTFVNVQKDGTTFYLKYESTGITLSSNSADAEVFVCRKTDNDKYVFVNNSGKYFAHKGAGSSSYSGVNSNKGYTDSYDQTADKYLNDFGIVKLTPSNVATTNNTDAIAVTNELLFGYVGLYTRRHDREEDVYYIFKKSNGFDQAGAPFCRHDLTSMVLIKPAEYANTPVLTDITDNTLINVEGSMATFSAPFATVLPDGVTAYAATDNGSYVSLNEIDGAVPANTGVILVGAADTGKITMKPAAGEAEAEISSNALGNSAGAAITLTEGQHYLLGAVNGVPGFYLSGAGTLAMNKAYLAIPVQGNSVVVRFPGTTDINEVKDENGEVNAIYDLTGRRVEAITVPGIYIVNGKKVLVK